jgi:hypothetical protein
MKILLQNRKTRRYVANGGNWSENAEAALVFPDIEQARRHGTNCGLSGLRIVALVGRERGEITMKSLEPKELV